MFSVIIPLFNKESSIHETIYSILRQTFTEFEIIIVNDGSTDNSVKVVESINDSRIRLIHQVNQGVSAARNHGINEANFEWITFLDGDDLWVSEHLFEFKRRIEVTTNVNWLFSGFTIDNNKKQIHKVFNIDGKQTNIFDSLLAGVKIHTSTVCVKRSLFTNFKGLYFRTGLNNSEDREVWYKLACIDKNPIYIAKSLSVYKKCDSNSLTLKNKIEFNEQSLEMDSRIEDFSAKLEEVDRIKLLKFIAKFNRTALLGRYEYGTFKLSYNRYLNIFEYYLLKKTVKLPYFIRHKISRVLCFF